jgi:hypothetical protein
MCKEIGNSPMLLTIMTNEGVRSIFEAGVSKGPRVEALIVLGAIVIEALVVGVGVGAPTVGVTIEAPRVDVVCYSQFPWHLVSRISIKNNFMLGIIHQN